MSTDRLAHQPRLRRPTAVIGWICGLYLVTTLPLTMISLEENWRHPVAGLTAWMGMWLVIAVPLTAVAAVLAGRMERAATGLRHPMRAAWVGVALGAVLAAHWLWHLLWTPTLAFWGLTSSYRNEENLLAAFLCLLAWVFFAVGVAVARLTGNRMRARSWDGVEPSVKRRTLPRLPTPVVGAIAYGLALLPLSVLVGVFAVDERSPVLAVAAWGALGLVSSGLGAAWGAWAYEGMDHGHEPTRLRPRFAELFGAAWVAHWIPAWFFAAIPLHNDSRHEEQLVASMLIAVLLLVGTGLWSYGRAARLTAAT